jgi:hypothetical protein
MCEQRRSSSAFTPRQMDSGSLALLALQNVSDPSAMKVEQDMCIQSPCTPNFGTPLCGYGWINKVPFFPKRMADASSEQNMFDVLEIDFPSPPMEFQMGPFYSTITPFRIVRITSSAIMKDPFGL